MAGHDSQNWKVLNTCRHKDIFTRYAHCGKQLCYSYEQLCQDVEFDTNVCSGTMSTSCDGYQREGSTNKYYKVIDSLAGTMSEAEQMCVKTGGTLAMLHTVDIRNSVRRIINDQMRSFDRKPNKHGLWVGGHYASDGGKFVWNDNTEIPSDSELWHGDEPSTLTRGIFNTECVLLYPSLNYCLGDYQCDPNFGPLLPLCECKS